MGVRGIFSERRIFMATVVAGIVLGSVVVRGGPPMLTDDPGTPGDKHWEIDLAATTVRAPDSRQSELPVLALTYGIGERWQINVQASWLVHKDDGAKSAFGVSNPVFGAKWRFYDPGEPGWQVAVAPEFEFGRTGSKSVELGLVQRGVGVGLPILFEKSLGRWTLDLDVGYFYQSEGEDEIDYGVLVSTEVKPGVQLLAEVHGNTATRFNGGALAVNIGASFDVGKRSSFQMSFGRELFNDGGERATLLAYVGWQWRL